MARLNNKNAHVGIPTYLYKSPFKGSFQLVSIDKATIISLVRTDPIELNQFVNVPPS